MIRFLGDEGLTDKPFREVPQKVYRIQDNALPEVHRQHPVVVKIHMEIVLLLAGFVFAEIL
jgi:hypothetical protein